MHTDEGKDGHLAASGDRVTDERSREEASPPSGSVPTGARFTPGPWGPMMDGPADREPWEPWEAYREAAPGLTIGSVHNTEPVARVSGYLHPCVANARLIAAAPTFADIAARIQHRANECGGDYEDIPRDELNAFMVELDHALEAALSSPMNREG